MLQQRIDRRIKMAKKVQVKNTIVQAVLKECQNLKGKDDLTEELEHARNIKDKKQRLIKSIALAREASRRTINIEPYPVQILAAVKMYQGRIIEMKTGEGKTFVSPMTAFAKVLDGQKVHVLTVNDYLVERDYDLLRPVYEVLGLSVGYITTDTSIEDKKKAYACDVCYITNSEVGFDYLNDHLAMHPDLVVCNGKYDFAIIDEADSILIDEARTPLIIAEDKELLSGFYISCAKFVRSLELSDKTEELEDSVYIGEFPKVKGDVIQNLKYGLVYLTENGARKAEEYFNVDHLDKFLLHNLNNALIARFIKKRGIDYIVKANEIIIIDNETGRIAKGRSWSDGLHQAVQAKEGVEVGGATETAASVTYQCLFKQYNDFCGMTGTAKTERREFKKIYNKKVFCIPTNRPVIRVDKQDRIFARKEEKYQAILEETEMAISKGRAVLVGTSSIATSEELSDIFDENGVGHDLLNAKLYQKEADIIAEAGSSGNVVIATNMAGRGTDIKLDEKTRAAGGLLVIGAEHNESKRIDNQLRGRCGRQGDPGSTQFFVSLEDRLIEPYVPDNYYERMKKEKKIEETDLFSKKIVKRAQKRIGLQNYSSRKNLFDYDKVNQVQMRVIYNEREKILNDDMDRETVERIAKEMNMEDKFHETMKRKKEEGKDTVIILREQKEILLKSIDKEWKKHLQDLEVLKRNEYLKAYGNMDPVTQYRLDAYPLFAEMVLRVKKEFMKEILKE